MIRRMTVFTLLVAAGGGALLTLIGCQGRQGVVPAGAPASSSTHVRSIEDGAPRPHPYGKIRLPAEVSITAVDADGAGKPVTMLISASSLVPAESAVLTLRVPRIGAQPEHTEVLWARTPSDYVTETARYAVDALPEGQYCFTAILQFLPEGQDAKDVAISGCLYLDVRPAEILSSNVSFDQIKRIELRQELERRIAASLRPGLAIASEEAAMNELARLEAADPGFIDRRIEELKAAEPDVARRMMELNETEAVTPETPDGSELE